MRRTVFVFLLCMLLLPGCGPRGPSEEEIATQVAEQVAVELTTVALSATPTPTHTPTSTNTPTPTDSPTPRPTYTPTKTRTPTPTLGIPTATPTPKPTKTPTPPAAAIELVSYENERLAVVLKYPSDCRPRFSPPDPNFGEGELYIECENGLVALLLQWMPSSDDMTLEEEAEPHMGVGQVLVSHEPFAIGGESGYLTEWRWRDVHWLTVKTRYQGYFYRFNWRSKSYEKVVTLFDLMLPHIRFAPTLATATPQLPTPTPLPPTPTAGWHEIARWEGSGIKTTEQFYVPGDFRVSWLASGIVRDGYDVFQIIVYQNGNLHSVAANFMGLDTTDISHIYTSGGSFHLVINSTMNWIVRVEVQ